MESQKDHNIALNQEIKNERIQIFDHKDLNEEEKLYLRNGIRALEKFNEGEVRRRELTDAQIDYLLAQEGSFTIISQNPDGHSAYHIYSRARSGETTFLEASNSMFDTSLPETSVLMERYETREQTVIEHAKRKANRPYFRNYAPTGHLIPEVTNDQNENTVIETRSLIKTVKSSRNFIKIPNGRSSDNVALNFSNEPSTEELTLFLTDQMIAERVLYCPNIYLEDDYRDAKECAPGYIFICDDQPKSIDVFRNGWDQGRLIRIVNGMPQMERSVCVPDGVTLQEIREETCPVTFAFLEKYRDRVSRIGLNEGKEQKAIESKSAK